MNPHLLTGPSSWVQRFSPQIATGGDVLDLACGQGRHSRYLAELGYRVEALDRDAAALASLQAVPGVTARLADVEDGPWPYHARQFDGIVVTNYLHRPLLPLLINAVGEGGVLIYETFMLGNERFGKPSNPHFLLRPGELLEVVRRRLHVVAFEEGEVDAPHPAVVQRLCATRGATLKIG
ncbi:MAG: methyltransferase domain-containing protein [Rhodocyclaceae bacterium]|nr:methyltransferase domain-containing protein [Rhodocyclaceae bacterium]